MDTEIRVLIADDEQIARETMRDYLPWAEMGMQTPICVENGALALDHLCHDKIDIFIMDIYNIGTTVLNSGISMVIFFFVNKIIFPEGQQKKD